MRWYFGYPILAAGLVFGGHIFLPKDHALSRPAAAPSALPPAQVIDLAHDTLDASRVAAFSPGARLETGSLPARPHASVLDYLARSLTPGALSQAALTPAVPQQPVTAPEWKLVHVSRQTESEGRRREPRGTLSPRVSLTQDIQRELKRVGCYWGQIDGVWGGGSKRAMVMFMDRVNATLPPQEPDVFMLSLLRGQDAQVCGTECPTGQSLTGSGRCLPSTLMAEGGRDAIERPRRVALAAAGRAREEVDRSFETTAWEATVTTHAVKPLLSGRMAIGGPKPSDIEPSDIEPRAIEPRDLELALAPAASQPALPDDARRMPDPRPHVARASSFDSDEIIQARPARATSARPRAASRPAAPRRVTNYRHVQRLFEHPLGRM